jgi:signal transduction histidine kinase
MRWWRFLRYERPYFLLFAASFLLTTAVYFTDPGNVWHWDTFIYVVLLLALLFAGFFFHRYTRNLRAIHHMNDEDMENLSLEAQHYRQAMEEMEKAHIRALNDVQDKQKEYYDFIVSWFHEIKTPIAVLRLMQQTEVDAKSLEEEVGRIEHYVDQALYYAKLDSFNQDYELVNCDLEPLVKELVKRHSRTFISRKIRIQLAIEASTVQSDSKWLLFIVDQLLTNSLKYADELGEISIEIRDTPQEKQLVIRDDGIGIEPKDMPRIFNRGFTGTNGRTHTKSTGMGLYLAQELSNKLGHYITCSSEVGRYTEFVVHFPRNHDPYLTTLKASING